MNISVTKKGGRVHLVWQSGTCFQRRVFSIFRLSFLFFFFYCFSFQVFSFFFSFFFFSSSSYYYFLFFHRSFCLYMWSFHSNDIKFSGSEFSAGASAANDRKLSQSCMASGQKIRSLYTSPVNSSINIDCNHKQGNWSRTASSILVVSISKLASFNYNISCFSSTTI